MANAILNFHFDFLTTSLIISLLSPVRDKKSSSHSGLDQLGGGKITYKIKVKPYVLGT